MERLFYWFRRILKHKWKQCKSFCVTCEYYDECKSDGEYSDIEMNIEIEEIKQKEISNLHNESGTIVI